MRVLRCLDLRDVRLCVLKLALWRMREGGQGVGGIGWVRRDRQFVTVTKEPTSPKSGQL